MAKGKSPGERFENWIDVFFERGLFWGAVLGLVLVHFHDPSIFKRPLIAHDDSTFVGLLKDFSVHDYFTKWLFLPDKYAFPLRDFTFLFDFLLSRVFFGLQFFWLSSLVYFVWVVWVVRKIARHLMPGREMLIDLALAFFMLHPTNVETIQWIWIRKHILAGLFVALGTLRAIQVRETKPSPSFKDWGIFVFYYVCSLLSYPTGMLWIFWVFYFFRKPLLADRQRTAWVGTVGLILFGVSIYLVIAVNSSFLAHLQYLFGEGNLFVAVATWFTAIGRGFFNLLVPVWMGPYYTPWHPFAWLGGVAGLAFWWWLYRLPRGPQYRLGIEIQFLALACFLTSSYVLFNPLEYIWGDHYAYLPLHFFLLGTLLFLPERNRDWLTAPANRKLWLIVFAFFIARSGLAVHTWEDDFKLMSHCARLEGAPRCVGLSMEKGFDQFGCAKVVGFSDQARAMWDRYQSTDFVFQMNTPFYEGLCVGLLIDVPLAEKERKFIELAEVYGPRDNFIFGQVLALLKAKNIVQARALAYATYLNPEYVLKGTSEKEINLFRGQGRALCALAAGQSDDCKARLDQFFSRYPVPSKEVQISFGEQMSIAPFMNQP